MRAHKLNKVLESCDDNSFVDVLYNKVLYLKDIVCTVNGYEIISTKKEKERINVGELKEMLKGLDSDENDYTYIIYDGKIIDSVLVKYSVDCTYVALYIDDR